MHCVSCNSYLRLKWSSWQRTDRVGLESRRQTCWIHWIHSFLRARYRIRQKSLKEVSRLTQCVMPLGICSLADVWWLAGFRCCCAVNASNKAKRYIQRYIEPVWTSTKQPDSWPAWCMLTAWYLWHLCQCEIDFSLPCLGDVCCVIVRLFINLLTLPTHWTDVTAFCSVVFMPSQANGGC